MSLESLAATKNARQLTRAVALSAATKMTAVEYNNDRRLGSAELHDSLRYWVNQFEYYIERGRWPTDEPR